MPLYQEQKTKKQLAKLGKDEANEYLFAGRSLSAFPVSMSLTASFMSALTMLGWPSEFYNYGTMFAWFMLTFLLTAIITAYFFIPLFYNSGVNSTYEYLIQRYHSKSLTIITEIVYILNTILYAGIVCYAPALALNAVIGMNIWLGVTLTAGVCTFYTSLGGLKAVVWTDVFQSLIMVSGFLMIAIKASIDFSYTDEDTGEFHNGFSVIWDNAADGGRLDFFEHFKFDVRDRHSFWSVVVGGTFGIWLGTFSCNQTEVQRYLSCKSLRQAQIAIFISVMNLWALVLLGGFAGLAMYSYYKYCDPIQAGWLSKTDQLIPYWLRSFSA